MLEMLNAGQIPDIFFFGGVADDDATRNRVLGFKEALAAHGIALTAQAFDCCGYPPTNAAQSLAAHICRSSASSLGPVRQRRDCA